MTPVSINLHPDEVELGATLIVAAAGAVQRPGGGVVAAWDFTHVTDPLYHAEHGVARMCEAAAARLRCPCRCFAFKVLPQNHGSGLIPANPGPWPTGGLVFEPMLDALAESVRAGDLALVVADGRRTVATAEAMAPLHPGILRFRPCGYGEPLVADLDAFAEAGFPTLVVSSDVVPGRWSAHEVLELSARLADAIAVAPSSG